MSKTLELIIESIVSQFVNWADEFIDLLPRLIVAIIVVALFSVLARLSKRVTGLILDKIIDSETLKRLLQTMVHVVVTILGLFIALSILQLSKTVSSMLAGVGVIGLALGFAFQETAANFMSGVFLAVKRPYAIGDVIEVGGSFGVVKALNLRTTDIESWNGQMIIVPNKELFQGRFKNYSSLSKRRVDLSVGVSYAENLEDVKEAVQRAIDRNEYKLDSEQSKVYLTEFGGSSINLEVQLWIPYNETNAHYFEAKDQLIMCIKDEFDKAGITIPFPIRTLDFGIKGGEKLNAMLNPK